MMRHARYRWGGVGAHRGGGFTLVEVVVAMVCLTIAAMIVLPAVSDNSGDQLRGAAQILVADLEYAQAQSMSRGDDPRLIVIDADRAGYRIAATSAPADAVTNPADGFPHETRFGSGRASALPGVTIAAYSLGGDDRLGFRAMGQLDQATPATIQLACRTRTLTLTIDGATGEIAIGPIQ